MVCYIIEIKSAHGDTYTIQRRYSDFWELFKAINENFKFASIKQFNFPPKDIFFAESEDVKDKRKISFNELCQRLIVLPDRPAIVSEFFQLPDKLKTGLGVKSPDPRRSRENSRAAEPLPKRSEESESKSLKQSNTLPFSVFRSEEERSHALAVLRLSETIPGETISIDEENIPGFQLFKVSRMKAHDVEGNTRVEPDCPKGHGKLQAPDPSGYHYTGTYSCNVCGKTALKGHPNVWWCSTCDFDVCPACAFKRGAEIQTTNRTVAAAMASMLGSGQSLLAIARATVLGPVAPTFSEEDFEELKVGTKVEFKRQKEHNFRPGVVTKTNQNNTFDIQFEEGCVEAGVPKSLVRILQVDRALILTKERLLVVELKEHSDSTTPRKGSVEVNCHLSDIVQVEPDTKDIYAVTCGYQQNGFILKHTYWMDNRDAFLKVISDNLLQFGFLLAETIDNRDGKTPQFVEMLHSLQTDLQNLKADFSTFEEDVMRNLASISSSSPRISSKTLTVDSDTTMNS